MLGDDKEHIPDILSPREKEILLLKQQNFTIRQIANKLGIHRGTVCVHLERIEKKCLTVNDQIRKNHDIIKRKRKIK